MPKKRKIQLLFALPVAVLMFLGGWFLSFAGASKVKGKPVKVPRRSVGRQVSFGVISLEEQKVRQ